MKLRETIDLFLGSISEKSVDVYAGKINYFYNFLVDIKGINDNSFQSYLASMRVIEIIESLDNYVVKNDVTKTTVALHYISVVRRYFHFLYNLGIENNNLLKLFSLERNNIYSFSYKVQEVVNNDKRLTAIDVKEALSFEEIQLLIIECDEEVDAVINNPQLSLDNTIPSNKYNNLMAAIMLKIMVFTGIKFKVLNTIKIVDLDIKYNTICINNFKIHLPDNLGDQIKFYLDNRKKIESETDLLFVKSDGKKFGRNSSIVAERMEGYIGRTDTTGITKFGVIEMIKKGVNQSILQEFTGVGNDIFKDCQKKVNGEKNQYASRYLDSKLRSMKISDIL